MLNFDISLKKIYEKQYAQKNNKRPCGSKKKYKKCHSGSKDKLMDFYQVNIIE